MRVGERRRGLVVAVILGAWGILSGLWVAFHLQDLGSPPWADRVAFNFPFGTAMDQTGRSYTSDSATSRLVALDRDGSLRWVMEGRKRSHGFYNALALAVDSRNDLYVTNWVPLPQQDAVAQEIQIQHYTPSGQLVGTPFRWVNATESSDFPGYFSFSIQSDRLFIVHSSAAGYDLLSVPVAGGEPTLVRSVSAPLDFVAIASQSDGRLVGAARNGTLWSASPRRDWTRLEIAGIHKPWDVKFDPDGELLVLDLLQGSIVKVGPSGQRVMLDSHETGGTLADTFSVSTNGTVVVADKELQRLLVSPIPGEVRVFEGARYTGTTLMSRWVTWGALVFAIVVLLMGMGALWLSLSLSRVPPVIVQLTLLIPVLVVTQVLTYEHVHAGLLTHERNQAHTTLRAAAHLAAQSIEGSDLTALNSPGDLDSPAYRRLQQRALEVRSRGRETHAFSYIALYRNLDAQAHIVLTGSGIFGVFYPYPNFPPQVSHLFTTPGVGIADYSDDYGEYTGGFASILAPDGTTAGVVEVGLYADLVSDVASQKFAEARGVSRFAGATVVMILVLLTLVLARSTDSLRRISRSLAEGRIVLPPELNILAPPASLPRRLLRRHRDAVARAASEEPFVPRALLELLDGVDVTACHRGDQVQKDLTVLATRLVTPSDHDVVIPALLAHRGVLDRALGGLVRVLYPRDPAGAFAAVRLATARLAPGAESQQARFGIHSGPVLVGVVGEEARLSVTAFSGAVTWAETLCDLAERYQVSAVTTASTLEKAPGVLSRRLDHVRLAGSPESVLICEPLDERDPRKSSVLDHLGGYEEAFTAWELGHLEQARAGFEALSQRNPEDPVVKRLADRCRKRLEAHFRDAKSLHPWSPVVDVHDL